MPVCEKCGEVYADMKGECPTCRKRNQQNFWIWVLALFVLTIVAALAYRVFVW